MTEQWKWPSRPPGAQVFPTPSSTIFHRIAPPPSTCPRQRINKFNMAKQAEQYDAEAEYIKTWVPEVAGLPPKYARAPWELSDERRLHAGVPEAYPAGRPVIKPGYSEGARLGCESWRSAPGAHDASPFPQ